MTGTDLEKRSLEQFDRLLQNGELFWKPVPVRNESDGQFEFSFYVADSLKSKPIDTEQKKPTTNAFPDSEGDWSLGIYNGTHKLILNKFCVVRPQFVLPTVDYQPQSDALNHQDFCAVGDALHDLGRGYYAIFNCGVDGGSSVGHKHMQVLPLPELSSNSIMSRLKAVDANNNTAETNNLGFGPSYLDELPYQHAICHFHQPSAGIGGLYSEAYERAWQTLQMQEGQPHNVILTHDWLLVVPRSVGSFVDANGDRLSCNAAGMVGVVFSDSHTQYEAWLRYGPLKALQHFGVKR